MKCEHLSPSRASLYEQCALRYKMHYELGLGESNNQRQDTGLFVHKALELYYSPHHQYTAEEAWQKAASGHTCTPLSEFLEAKSMYADTISTFPRDKLCTVDTEVRFDHTFESGLHIKGVIDRLDIMKNDCLRIVDFKTGSHIMTMQEMRDSHQTNMYALWAFTNPAFVSFSHIVFSYMYIREGLMRDLLMTKEQVMDYKQYAESLSEQILTNTDPKPSLNSYCYNCPGRNTCPAFTQFVEEIMKGEMPFKDSIDVLTLDSIHDVVSKIKAGISILEREKKMIDAWMVCMLEENPDRKYTTASGVTLSLTSKKSVKPDIGVVMGLAQDRGVTDDVIDVQNSTIERVFKDDEQALHLIRTSSTVEYGQPYVTTSKAKKK